MTDFDHYYNVCGFPTATTSDISAWKTLDAGTTSSTSVTKVGLFGYDITCLMEACAVKEFFSYACTFLFAGNKDGWSMGVEVDVKIADGSNFAACQHQEYEGDICLAVDTT